MVKVYDGFGWRLKQGEKMLTEKIKKKQIQAFYPSVSKKNSINTDKNANFI